MRGWTALSLLSLVAVGLSGCSGGDNARAELPELSWAATYTITTTPLEPFELQGTNVFGYDSARPANRGLFVENEDDMARQNVRIEGTWYTTTEGRGWIAYPDAKSLDASSRAHRIQTWDIRGLVESARTAVESGNELVTVSTVTANGRTESVTVTATLSGGRVVSASIDSPFDPESPYTAVAGGELPFSIKAPASSISLQEAQAGDAAARNGHARIIGWIDDYRTQTGSLPQNVDAQTLAVQRLGQPWPNNPFTGQPMQNRDKSGDFIWHYCDAQDGTYKGLGWDQSPLGESFGSGCKS